MISIQAINKTFGTTQVLHDVSFDIKPGTMTGFVGGNGAGKSTTMRILLGVMSHDSGEILVDGQPIDAGYRAQIGYMPEERGLYPKMGVLEQLIYLGRLHGVSAGEAKLRGQELLDVLGLGERATDNVEELSLGNQQRAQIAAALVHDPVALILDEPFSGLDPIAVDTTVEVLRQVAEAGAPVLFSSHQLDVVERLCDELVIIADGRVVANGTRQQLLAESVDPEWEMTTTSDTGWVRDAGVEVTEFDGGYVRFKAASPEAAHQVLQQASAHSTVLNFGPVQHTLHEIYRETVR